MSFEDHFMSMSNTERSMFKRFLFAAVISMLIVTNPASAPGAEYSLDDLYRLALERSEKIKLAEENIVVSEAFRQKAIAGLNPKLTASASYTRFTDQKRTAETDLGFLVLPGTLYQPYEAIGWGLRMDYIFSLSGNSITALNISNKSIEKSRFDLAAVKEEFLLAVTAAYYDYLKAVKLQQVAAANVERLLQYRNAGEKRLKVGEVTRTVLLRAESELASAQSDMVKAANAVAISKAVLARLVGIDSGATIIETRPRETALQPLAYYQNQALSHRPDIQSSEIQRKIAEYQVIYNKGSYWPYLSLSAVYARSEQCPAISTLNRESMFGTAALNFPFYEGGLRIAEVREAKAREKQAQLQYEDLKKSILIEVQASYLDLQAQKGALAYREAQKSYARDNYRAVSRQFDFGLANSIDVIDATTALVAAETSLTEAEYNYQVAIMRLKKARGVFMREVIGEEPGSDLKK